MKIRLQHKQLSHQPVSAAFLRSANAENWLKEISSWDIDIVKLDFFIIPESLSSIKAAGLFVIFNTAAIDTSVLLEPYSQVGKHLYIPANTELFPPVGLGELDTLLLWDIQVYHPTIGLIGFISTDSIQASSLISYAIPRPSDWSFAHPGIAEKPSFQQIELQSFSAEQVMEELKEEIGQKDFARIPIRPDEKRSSFEKMLDLIQTFFLRLALWLISFFDKILSTNHDDQQHQEEGTLNRLQKTIEAQLSNLQKRRNDELQRLLNMFDHDTDEALQYAIPLSSPYLNRGSASRSSVLSRNSVRVNLQKLRGGNIVDGWDLGDHQQILRLKYLKAAQQELGKKDFKKAAYVYAHLLGDYNLAANVLEQGNFHREAATLFKDHLKDKAAAAKCLENGGLYLEAIDVYKDLQQDEKVGDLFHKLRQEDNAVLYFENCIATKIKQNDYLDAARVMQEKLAQEERAANTLLEGWKGTLQFEACLKKYFDITNQDENNDVENRVKDIYNQHTPQSKKTSFLNVLEYLNKQVKNPGFLDTSQDLAYEIIHEQTERGNLSALHSLKSFLPGDLLIGSDTSRFYSLKSSSQKSTSLPVEFFLDKDFTWIESIHYGNQVLVAGTRQGHLHLARFNWYGNIEYYNCNLSIEQHSRIHFIPAPLNTQRILLQVSDAISMTRINLPKNKYFNNQLTISRPVWLNNNEAKFIIHADNNIYIIEPGATGINLNSYSIGGKLLESQRCLFENDAVPDMRGDQYRPLFFSQGYFYTHTRSALLLIAIDGQAVSIELDSGIRMIGAVNYAESFYMVISTNGGCYLCEPEKGQLKYFGAVFAEQLIPQSIDFISNKVFVLSEKLRATVFQIIDYVPHLIYELSCSTPIAGVMAGGERNTIAVVEENGKVSVHDITPEER